MPDRLIQLGVFFIKAAQWFWILSVGVIASTGFDYKEDLHKVLVTVISMLLGTVVSYYAKKFLNRNHEKRN